MFESRGEMVDWLENRLVRAFVLILASNINFDKKYFHTNVFRCC